MPGLLAACVGLLAAGEFDVVVVESDHDDMFDEPQVQHVTAELAARLRGSGVFRPTIRSNMAPAHCRHRVKEEIPKRETPKPDSGNLGSRPNDSLMGRWLQKICRASAWLLASCNRRAVPGSAVLSSDNRSLTQHRTPRNFFDDGICILCRLPG